MVYTPLSLSFFLSPSPSLRREKPPIMVFVNARKSADVLFKDVQRQVNAGLNKP